MPLHHLQMCFSASASFTAAAVLIPLGLYSTHIARTNEALAAKDPDKRMRRGYVPLALVPMFFGIQQLFEGLVWTGIDYGQAGAALQPLTTISSVGFLFFAYCFWMLWIPWCAYSIARENESRALAGRLQKVWWVASVLGVGFILPILFNPPTVQPALHGRLLYNLSELGLWHNFVNTEPLGELIYWAFIVLPLVFLSDKAVRLFGVLIFVSILLTWITYAATFNSVWCFYCAVLSIMVIWIVNRQEMRHA